MGNLLSLKLFNEQETRLRMVARISLESFHLAFEKYLLQFGFQNILMTFREFSRLFSHVFKRDELQMLFALFKCDIKDNAVIRDEFDEEIENFDKISIFEVLGTFIFLCDIKVAADFTFALILSCSLTLRPGPQYWTEDYGSFEAIYFW